MFAKTKALPQVFRLFYPRISTRLIVPFLLVIIAIAGVGIFIVTQLVAGSIQERFNNQLIDSANAASNSIVDIERQHLATLRLMAYTDGVADAIVASDVTNLDSWLRPIAANAYMDDVIVFDTSGKSILRLRRVENTNGIEYELLPSFSIVNWVGAAQVVELQPDPAGDKFVDVIADNSKTLIYFSAPVKNQVGQTVGGISLGIQAAHIAERTSEQALSAIALLTLDGQVIASTFRSVPAEILRLPPAEASQLKEAVGHSSPVYELTLNRTTYQVLYAPFDLRGQPVGLLLVGLPSHYIVQQSGTSRDIFSVLFSALFVVVGVMGVTVARTITRPVARLVDTTRAIREGDLSQRVGLDSPDELGELSVSFDHMTDQLVRRNKQIKALYVKQLEETARREAVLASISDAVIVQDSDANIILQNPAAQSLLTRVSGDLTMSRRLVELTRQPEQLALPQTVELGDGFFSALSKPVLMDSGNLLGYVIVFRDITAIVQAERLKDQLILQMSHELRTPLAVARGYVDLLKILESPRLSQQGCSFLESTVNSLATLERLVNQVIDVSSIISHQLGMEITRFDLVQVLENRIMTWKPIMIQRDLILENSVTNREIWIEGDAVRIGQVIDYLLRNSYSYTLPGGSVAVNVIFRNRSVSIHVLDTGVGITPDEIDQVFERMFRGSAAEAGPTDSRGMGLGLYLSKHIIEAHRGTIAIESKLNVGTIVRIELPVSQSEVV